MTKQLQHCNSFANSALQEDRNQAACKSASNVFLSSMPSYPKVPTDFPSLKARLMFVKTFNSDSLDWNLPVLSRVGGYWLCRKSRMTLSTTKWIPSAQDKLCCFKTGRSSKFETGLIKEGKQIFHPAWSLAFLKEVFHLNKKLMIQWKADFIALFEKVASEFRISCYFNGIFLCILYISFDLFII